MFPGLSTPLVPLATFGLFVLGATAFSTVASQAPALNEGLQVEGAAGTTRLLDLPSMYDDGKYLYQTGYGYLNAPMTSLVQNFQDTDGTAREIEPFEAIVGYLTQAGTHLEQSLRLDPANAHAWLAYARTQTALEALDRADLALSNSWHLAPSMTSLARKRIPLIGSLRTLREMPDGYAEIRTSDLAVVRQHTPGLADRLAAR